MPLKWCQSLHDSLGFCEIQPTASKIPAWPRHATAKIAFRVEPLKHHACAQRDSTWRLAAKRRQAKATSRRKPWVFERNPFRLKHINSMRRCCDKARANWRHAWGTLNRMRRHFDFLRAQGRWQSGCGTLNDTELRKNFRRKNTAWKSFLEHARRLNDLPIEAAKIRPTPRFAAHGERFIFPRPGGLP